MPRYEPQPLARMNAQSLTPERIETLAAAALIRHGASEGQARALAAGIAAAERAAIIDDFYGAYEAGVAAAPEGHRMDYVHCVTEIAKAN